MLRCARKSASQWEKILSRFRLAHYQLKNGSIQQLGTNADGAFPHAHDPDMKGPWYGQPGVRQEYSYADLTGCGLVPARRSVRKVPEWALSDEKVRVLLLRLYPRLFVPRKPHNHRDTRKGQTVRRMAAITALVIYRAYRQVLSDRVIAEELGISPSAVSNRLDKVKQIAEELFPGKREGVTEASA